MIQVKGPRRAVPPRKSRNADKARARRWPDRLRRRIRRAEKGHVTRIGIMRTLGRSRGLVISRIPARARKESGLTCKAATRSGTAKTRKIRPRMATAATAAGGRGDGAGFVIVANFIA